MFGQKGGFCALCVDMLIHCLPVRWIILGFASKLLNPAFDQPFVHWVKIEGEQIMMNIFINHYDICVFFCTFKSLLPSYCGSSHFHLGFWKLPAVHGRYPAREFVRSVWQTATGSNVPGAVAALSTNHVIQIAGFVSICFFLIFCMHDYLYICVFFICINLHLYMHILFIVV